MEKKFYLPSKINLLKSKTGHFKATISFNKKTTKIELIDEMDQIKNAFLKETIITKETKK